MLVMTTIVDRVVSELVYPGWGRRRSTFSRLPVLFRTRTVLSQEGKTVQRGYYEVRQKKRSRVPFTFCHKFY